MTREERIATVRGLIGPVLRRHPHVTRAVLFGSWARGIARANSDIDLVVDGGAGALEAEAIARELDELAVPYRFDVIARTSIRSPELLRSVSESGVEVYG